jgi:hypothetical protein
MPKSKQRNRAAERRAKETQAAQAEAEKKKITPEQYMRRRAFGWALVSLAIVVAVTHWFAHVGMLYDDKPIWDLTIGWPMAGLLGIWGAIVLSK